MKFGLLAALLAFCLALTNDGCIDRNPANPCNQCTTVTPTYSILPAGLYVKPPQLPDITGSILKVTRLADSTVIMFDTIEPGGFRIVPVNLDSTAINVRLDFLTSAPLPTRLNAPKYCPSSDDFLPGTTLGLIVMDVVLQHNPSQTMNACTYSCGLSSLYQVQSGGGSSTYTVSIPDHNPGSTKYITVNGVKLLFEFYADTNTDSGISVKVFYCSSNTTPTEDSNKVVYFQDFSVSYTYNLGTNDLKFIITQTGTSALAVYECRPLAQ